MKGKNRGISLTIDLRYQTTHSANFVVSDVKAQLHLGLPPEKPYELPVARPADLEGTPKADAMRKAQLEMIAKLRGAEPKRKREYQAPPFSWGAFICHGMP